MLATRLSEGQQMQKGSEPDGALSRLEDMLGALVESGRRGARFHRAAASLECILRTSIERRSALAFRAWSARVSEGAVNSELIYERGILIDSFSRARRRSEQARVLVTRKAQSLSLLACACQGRLAARQALHLWARWAVQLDREYFTQAAVRQINASRAHSLALATMAFLLQREVHALTMAFSEWRVALALSAQAHERQTALLSVHESVLADLRLRALCVFSCAASLRLSQLARRMSTWRRNAALAAPASALAARARALVKCLATSAASEARADEARLLRALARWGRLLRARLASELCEVERRAEQHLRVAVGATARRHRPGSLEQPARQRALSLRAAGSPDERALAATSPQHVCTPRLTRHGSRELLCSVSSSPPPPPPPTPSAAARPGLPDDVRAELAARSARNRPVGATPPQPAVAVRLYTAREEARNHEPSVAELQQVLVRVLRERDALQHMLVGRSPRSSFSPLATSIGGSEALAAALRDVHATRGSSL